MTALDELKIMKVKNGDIIEFLAISWDEPAWEFDHPTFVLKPFIRYYDDGTDCESALEDMAIDICCDVEVKDDYNEDEIKWRGWNIKTIKRVAKNRLAGKDDWKTKIREVVLQKVRFFEIDGELESEVIETIEA